MDEGTKTYSFDHIFPWSNPSVPVDKTKYARDLLKTAHSESGSNEESRANDLSKKIKLEDLSEFLKDTRYAFFTLDSPQYETIIVTNECEEEEANKGNTYDTSHDDKLEQQKAKAEAKIASLKASPYYPDINQLTDLLVTFLKPELSKLLASENFASCLPADLKELPLKFTELFGEIKELKQHVKDTKIELPEDLKEILTKLETFSSAISSLTSQVAELNNIQWELPAKFQVIPALVSSVQKKLHTLDSLPSLLNKVTQTLDRQTFVTQYYTKKLLFDKYCDKMLKRKKSSKITNCKVLTKKGPITLKIYREDGSDEVISNIKVLRRLENIFTSVYAVVEKLKKDSWKEL
uniref:Uncharacterized protein n=1 Tax=Tanacetum cinerariifolium TaxID=118510 RepID=A0A6L2NKK2_TANCI|nr:hypothetical protein [Tanacetum cinerariifolium]